MIGIVGGAGPLAGVDILKKIIEETRADSDQEHVPVILISIPQQTPDRTQFLLGKESRNPGEPLSQLFLRLEKAGAHVGAIPCNTAHAPEIYERIQENLKAAGSKLKLVDMIQETIQHIKQQHSNKKVGVLSTLGTWKSGLYKLALEKADIPIVTGGESFYKKVHQSIYDPLYGIKAQSSPVTIRSREELAQAMDWLIAEGAEVIILGCTEIPLAIPERVWGETPLVDPNRILARSLIAATEPDKLKPEHNE